VKLNDGRFGRYSDSAAAFWALALLADVFIPDADFMSTVFAAKPNHKTFSLLRDLLVLQLWRFSGRAVLSCPGTVPQISSI
jgi:hypothetical protein